MIFTKLTFDDFWNDSIIQGAYSYEGAKLLFDYLTDFGSESEPIEFDPIAIRCDFAEYSSIKELAGDYPDYTIEEMEDYTIVLSSDQAIVIQLF